MKTNRGEIATLLTLISVGLMLVGLVVGNLAVQQTTRTQPQAIINDPDNIPTIRPDAPQPLPTQEIPYPHAPGELDKECKPDGTCNSDLTCVDKAKGGKCLKTCQEVPCSDKFTSDNVYSDRSLYYWRESDSKQNYTKSCGSLSSNEENKNYCLKSAAPPPVSTKTYQAQGIVKNTGNGKLTDLKIRLWVKDSGLDYDSGYDGINSDGSFTANTIVKGIIPTDAQCFIGITPIDDDKNIVYSGPFFKCSDDTSDLNITIDYSTGTSYIDTQCTQFAAKLGHTQADCQNINKNSCKPDNYWYDCISGGVCPYDNRVGLGYPFRCFTDKTSYNMNTSGECTWACPGPSQPPLKKDNRCLSDKENEKGRLPLNDGTVINNCVRRHCVYDPSRNNKTYYINIIEACKDGGVYEGPGTFTDIECSLKKGYETTTNNCNATSQAQITPIDVKDERVPPKGSPGAGTGDCKSYQCPNDTKKTFSIKKDEIYEGDCNSTRKMLTVPEACGVIDDKLCKDIGGNACKDTAQTCKSFGGKTLGTTSDPSGKNPLLCPSSNPFCCWTDGKPVPVISFTPVQTAPSTGNTTTLTGGNCEYTFSPSDPESGKEFTVSVKNTKLSDTDAVNVGLISKKGSDQKINTSAQSTKPWTFKETKEAGDWTFTFGWKNCDSSSCGNTCGSVTKNIKSAGAAAIPSSSCSKLPYGDPLPSKCASCLQDSSEGKTGLGIYASSDYGNCTPVDKINYWCAKENSKCADGMRSNACKFSTTPKYPCLKNTENDSSSTIGFPSLKFQAYSNEGFDNFIAGVKQGKYNAIDASLYVLNATRVPGLQRLFCDPFKGQCDFYYQNPQVGT